MSGIELVYFDGCPNVDAARANIRAALEAADLPPTWREWNQSDPSAPAYVKQYGSPTVLVDGRDVTGVEAGVAASACRADGAPSAKMIRLAMAAVT